MPKNITSQRGFEACAKGLKEFGYSDVTSAMIEEIHVAWLAGKDLPHGVIARFAVGDFEKYPEIFGEKV